MDHGPRIYRGTQDVQPASNSARKFFHDSRDSSICLALRCHSFGCSHTIPPLQSAIRNPHHTTYSSGPRLPDSDSSSTSAIGLGPSSTPSCQYFWPDDTGIFSRLRTSRLNLQWDLEIVQLHVRREHLERREYHGLRRHLSNTILSVQGLPYLILDHKAYLQFLDPIIDLQISRITFSTKICTTFDQE